MNKGKRVFVSGAAGVIGCQLCRQLVEKGYQVYAGDLEPKPSDFPKNVVYRRGDLNYLEQCEIDAFDPNIFIHLAATFERSTETYQHWEENFWHNIRLSNHLMSLVRNVPSIQRVVNASSYLIYDKSRYQFVSPPSQPTKLAEGDPVSPRNLTGMAKLAHEVELDFLSKFKSDKFSSVSARIYRGYGRNSRDVISRWVRDLLLGKDITVYNDQGMFDYMFDADTAEGLIRLAEISYSGIVNLGTGRSRKVADIVSIIRNHFPSASIRYIQTNEKVECSEADMSLYESLTGWKPKWYLEDSIPEIIAFEKQRMQSPTFPSSSISNGNVLISSLSKKIPLLRAVEKGVSKVGDGIKVIGADNDEKAIGASLVEEFWHMPRLDDITSASVIDECEKRGVSMIIPTRDGELLFYAMNKSAFETAGISVMVSSEQAVSTCLDKLIFAQRFADYVIPTSLNAEDFSADSFVVKERFGAGGESIGLGLSFEQAVSHSKKLQSPIFQPYIEGNEFSTDVYVSRKGTLKGIVTRKRELVLNGESQITQTVNHPAIEKLISTLVEHMDGAYGHLIFQVMETSDNRLFVIECNPRFGGASTLSVKMGLDSFYWAYLEAMGEDIMAYPFFRGRRELKQVRAPYDIYLQ